jgi:hypothetical protein
MTKLPKLPNPASVLEAKYTAEQMREYARKAIEQAQKQEPAPVAKNEGGSIKWLVDDWPQNCLLYTSPPQRQPLTVVEEVKSFKAWFDAWWVGDGHQGESIPTRGDEFDEYLERYTLAFGAWMAAKEAAHGIKGEA